jgi:predicted nucleic acid-binding protein
MEASDRWTMCRIGYTETRLAVALSEPGAAPGDIDHDWAHFHVVDIDQRLAETAAELGAAEGLRTLDALHLAAALTLGTPVTFATWDAALHSAAVRRGLAVLPASLP